MPIRGRRPSEDDARQSFTVLKVPLQCWCLTWGCCVVSPLFGAELIELLACGLQQPQTSQVPTEEHFEKAWAEMSLSCLPACCELTLLSCWCKTDPANFQTQWGHWADEGAKPSKWKKFKLLLTSCSQWCFDLQVCVFYQSLALHKCDLGPEVGDGHCDGFAIEAVWGIPH